MNRPIRKVGVAFAVLFLALFVNLNVVQVVKGSSYRDNPGNRRKLLNEYSSPRGQIVVQGKAIADSRKTNDELKYLRVYLPPGAKAGARPNGSEYSAVTGYYSFIYGADGIENAENSILSGDSSKLFTTKLADLLTGRNPRGGSVVLTLNTAAQQAAYQGLKGRPGAVVAIDPTTGALLAVVSSPSYDPNALSSHNSGAIQHAYRCYLDMDTEYAPTESRGLRALRTAAHVSVGKAYKLRINAQLTLRRTGSAGYLNQIAGDKQSHHALYRLERAYFQEYDNFGKSGCGNVSDDPTALYAKDHALASPLANRAFQQLYPAGSIFKVIDAAAALEHGYQPDTQIPAPRYYWPLDPTKTAACPTNLAAPCVENFDGEECQPNSDKATLAFALAKSCNTAFAELAVHLGGSVIAEKAHQFGFDLPYPGSDPPDFCNPPALETPLRVCRSSPGSSSDLMSPDSLAQTAFGQRDVRVTPLQAAMLSAAAANDGRLFKPYLVQSELRPNLSVLDRTNPEQMGSQVLDPDLDLSLVSMMEGVVAPPPDIGAAATGQAANIPSSEFSGVVKVGGKTGTADVGTTSASKIPPDAWFTGFALVQGEPRIAVAVLLEHGGVAGDEADATGGEAAAPLAKQVITAYLTSTGVK
jgi:cell division protein FtsI/penicillin-binding protein 2